MLSTSSCVLEVPERMLKNLVGEIFLDELDAFSFVNFPAVESAGNEGANSMRENVLGMSNEAPRT
jgi:hypothetical protein